MAIQFTDSAAVFSPCRKYRYRLTRSWGGPPHETVCWLLLNCSTADDKKLDPTLTRCLNFSRTWGYNRMVVLNLFAYRSTDPKGMLVHRDPVGPWNDDITFQEVSDSDLLVVGWGNHGKHRGRHLYVQKIIEMAGKKPWCLGVTKSGMPKHPLYVPASQGLVSYNSTKGMV